MPTARVALSSSVANGKLYAIGGAARGGGGFNLSTVEEYDPVTDTWTTKRNMSSRGSLASTSTVDGKIYAIGGIGPGNRIVSTVEEYDPVTDTWTTKANMPTGRAFLSASTVNGNIYTIGGRDLGTVFSTVEVYDSVTDTWTRKVEIPTPIWGTSVSVIDGAIYAIGGSTTTAAPHPGVRTVKEYDPNSPLLEELIGSGEQWNIFRGTVEPSPLPKLAWTTPGFDDSGWETGKEGFGYGSGSESRDVVTVLDNMKDGYSTLYLRHTFDVENSELVSNLALDMDYDDGFIAYVNGVEVTRSNIGMAGTPEPHDATVRRRRSNNTIERFSIDLTSFPELLQAGDDNILAIQGINRSNSDGDFVLSQIRLLAFVPELTMFQAGDADQDFDFDQLDLVQVQIAAKYLTGQPATWSEGDWNGAPGGSVGSPPAGDGVFNQLDIVAAQQAGIYLTGPYAAVQPNGEANDGQTSIVYNVGTGELAVDTPAGTELTSINIDSAAGIFTGSAAENLGGSFDNDADNNIFKATFGSSFGSLSFGNVAQTGLAQDFLLGDLSVVGSLQGGGGLGDVDLVYVPESSGMVLLLLGAFALLARRRVPNV